MRLAAFVLGMGLGLSASLTAQTFGEITGEVHDPSGSVIAGADVRLTNTATAAQRVGASNDSGIYNFPALPPGHYDVTVSKLGFQSEVRRDIESRGTASRQN